MSKQMVLRRIAQVLLEKEVIEGEELRRLLKGKMGKSTTQGRRKRPKGS